MQSQQQFNQEKRPLVQLPDNVFAQTIRKQNENSIIEYNCQYGKTLIKIVVICAIIIGIMSLPDKSSISKYLDFEDYQQWQPVLYSQKKFINQDATQQESCLFFSKRQYPKCNNLKWTWFIPYIFFNDLYTRWVGNLTVASVQRARQYFRLGLDDPSQLLIEQQRQYYNDRYPGFFQINQQLHFCVLMVSYKNVAYDRYIWSIKSVLRQQYDNYHIVYIDDVSNDGTGYLVQQYINKNSKNPEKHKIIINNFRRLSLQNTYILASQHCGQHDIVFSAPDGDDALAGVFTLKLYNYYFQKFDMWTAWSAVVRSSDGCIWTGTQLPEEAMQPGKMKKYMLKAASPPRVFYNKLWNMVKVAKLMDADGTFYKSRQDNVEMLSVNQLARHHAKHIPQLTYLYHDSHGLNDDFVIEVSEHQQRLKHMQTAQEQQPIGCLFPEQNGQCRKASEYILQKKELKQEINVKDLQKSEEKYPNKIQKLQKLSKQELDNWPFSKESYQFALEYRELGLKEPSAQLIKRQKDFYNQKYNLSKTTLQFPFCVFITGDQNIQNDRYKLPLNSIFRQQYQNYHIVYVDDSSNDGTGEKVKQYIRDYAPFPEKHKVIFGKVKRNATYNHFIYAKEFCQPLDIQIIIGQSDSLVGTQVFRLYNHQLQQSNKWAIFGSYLNAETGAPHQNMAKVKEMLKSLTQDRQQPDIKNQEVYPLAFYTQLWLNVKPKDLLNHEGWFYWSQTSLSVSKRILDQAKFWYYVPQVLYLKIENIESSDPKSRSKIISTFTKQRQCLTLPPMKISNSYSKGHKKIKQIYEQQNCEEPRSKLKRLLIQYQNEVQVDKKINL